MRRVGEALYRGRGYLIAFSVPVLIGNAVVGRWLAADGVREVRQALVWVALVVFLVGFVVARLGRRAVREHAPVVAQSPVRGRWRALNSPATKVPSHGVRGYGQAYAIDLVHEPEDRGRPAFGGAFARRPELYPAFGTPVHAMIAGTVVRASAWRRDHRDRANLGAVLYMLIEGIVRDLGGAGHVIGNHVVIRGDDGVHAAVAHLQRGSLAVRRGDRVEAGQVIARCGNSGNTSEPHVHAQLMDRASFMTGQGIPVAFAGIVIGDAEVATEGLPENDQLMVAGAGLTGLTSAS